MKTLYDKKVNRNARKLNRQLKNDVFGDRFYVRQVQKSRVDGINYYMYEFVDTKDPERTRLSKGWYSAFEIYIFNALFIEMNDFIVTSDFWSTYNK